MWFAMNSKINPVGNNTTTYVYLEWCPSHSYMVVHRPINLLTLAVCILHHCYTVLFLRFSSTKPNLLSCLHNAMINYVTKFLKLAIKDYHDHSSIDVYLEHY